MLCRLVSLALMLAFLAGVVACGSVQPRTDWAGAENEVETSLQRLGEAVEAGNGEQFRRHFVKKPANLSGLSSWVEAVRDRTLQRLQFHSISVHGAGDQRTARTRWTVRVNGERRYGRTSLIVRWQEQAWRIERELLLLDELFRRNPTNNLGRSLKEAS